ncbi:Multicopper oxidase [Ceratobasidium sp. AG-Ba]|nr:Multicopper oxidase [Ceratobasidium sp. AG-Ba]
MRFALQSLITAAALAHNCLAALRQHSLVITNGTNNPDGTPRPSWFINGQTPGPHLVWDEGDSISVKVTNNGFEPITIHWHGISQLGTPWSDGVPGLTQYPIKPGQNLVYNFTVSQSGHHWYHSHSKSQLDDGLKGTIYIRPKLTRPRPFTQITNDTTALKQLLLAENRPLPLNVYDYRHYTSEYLMSEWHRTDIEQLCTDNILVNGKGPVRCQDMTLLNSVANPLQIPLTKKGANIYYNFRCMYPNSTLMYPYSDSKPELVNQEMWYQCKNSSTSYEVFTVNKADGWVSFNLLNSGGVWDLRVSIDQHKLYFYAADGQYVNVQVATSVLIPIGERYQFFVKLDQPVADYTIRVAAVVLPQVISGHAILSYTTTQSTGNGLVKTSVLPTAKTPYINYAGNIINGGTDLVTAKLAPYPNAPPPQGKPDLTLSLNVTRTNEFGWVLNGNTWIPPADNAVPLLFKPSDVATLDPKVYFSYRNGSVVDLLFTVTAGNPALHPPHPLHKHGLKAWHLGSGTGDFPYASISDAVAAGYSGINLRNPPLRDDFVTPVDITGKAWSAVRLLASDPGPVIMHCHIEPHLATGMAIVLLEGPELLKTGYVPSYYLNANKP